MHLDFEKPIINLENKLQEMLLLAKESKIDVSEQVNILEKQIDDLKRETFKSLTRWQRVELSRHPDRPYTLDYIGQIGDTFCELHGDRNYKDDKAIVGGLLSIDGKTYMCIGQQKGRNTKERQYRNFGMANPEGYRKAIRLMKTAEKFHKPIIAFIDTPGAFPGLEAEERGQAEAIAHSMQEMLKVKVPVVCIVIGEGASGGAIAIGAGDKVFMMENTWYSVISPESCSSILWRSWDYKEQAAEVLKLTATDMLSHHMINGIIEEPLGGAHRNMGKAAEAVKKVIVKEVKSLEKLSHEERMTQRITRITQVGQYQEIS